MEFLKLHPTPVILRRIIYSRFWLDQNVAVKTCRNMKDEVLVAGMGRSYFTCCGKTVLPRGCWRLQSHKFFMFNQNSMIKRSWLITHFYSSLPDDKSEHNVNEMKCNVESLVDTSVERASELDKMVLTISKSMLYQQVECLLNKGMNEEDMARLCSDPTTLKKLSNVVELMDTLYQYGFNKANVVYLVKGYPDIVKSQFISVFKELHNVGFSSNSIKLMILKCPALLDCNIVSKLSMIDELKLLFKRKDTLGLIGKSPEILFKDMDYILERFNFVFHHMGITQPQMRFTNLFSYPMEHIRARYMFVVRAGYFKKLKKSKGQLDLNPKLDTIIDTSDEEFAKLFGNMTSMDYRTFKMLLSKENVTLEEIDE